MCQTETSHRAQRLTAAHKKTSTTRAFLRKNKQKSCRYFTNTYELGTIKRNVISVIMCTQTERAQTSNVTRFARDGVGPFDCMCLCVCAGLNLTLFPPEKRPFTLTKGKWCSFISRIPRRFPRTYTKLTSRRLSVRAHTQTNNLATVNPKWMAAFRLFIWGVVFGAKRTTMSKKRIPNKTGRLVVVRFLAGGDDEGKKKKQIKKKQSTKQQKELGLHRK